MPAPEGNDYAKGNPGGGRPSSFDPKYIEVVRKLSKMGATNTDIGEALSVGESTVRYWAASNEDFSAALKMGKEESDNRVERSLYERAMGYTHEEDKVFIHQGEAVIVPTKKHYPPDSTSAIFWLKNRRPEEWRDKQEIEDVTPPENKAVSASDLARALLAAMGSNGGS